MKPIHLALASLLALAALPAAIADKTAKNDGPGVETPSVRIAPASELFPHELGGARRLNDQWAALDDELDIARQGVSLADPQAYVGLRSQIDAALKGKRGELDAWKTYYQRTADYWQSVLKAIQDGQLARTSERQDLVNLLSVEKKERDDIQRRLSDLTLTLKEKGFATEQPATLDLRELLALKDDNIEKLNAALHEFDSGVGHLDKRRELARARSLQARQLLRGVEVERPLWDALYGGRLNRLDLDRDSAIPPPERRPNDWKARVRHGAAPGGDR